MGLEQIAIPEAGFSPERSTEIVSINALAANATIEALPDLGTVALLQRVSLSAGKAWIRLYDNEAYIDIDAGRLITEDPSEAVKQHLIFEIVFDSEVTGITDYLLNQVISTGNNSIPFAVSIKNLGASALTAQFYLNHVKVLPLVIF